jgi:hypothetical protein
MIINLYLETIIIIILITEEMIIPTIMTINLYLEIIIIIIKIKMIGFKNVFGNRVIKLKIYLRIT